MNRFYSFTEKDLEKIPPRPARSHKGSFGRLLCVCGSHGMVGAAYLAAKAAYRTGAGLVEILTPEENRIPLQILLPEAVLSTYSDSRSAQTALTASLLRADAVVVGCGFGKSEISLKLVTEILRNASVPVLLDADALNLISERQELLSSLSGKIVTPHFQEFFRLTGRPLAHIASDPATYAQNFAKKHSCVCVLKDHNTVVADGGTRIYRNTTGNSGMATAGSGDVLAGIIGGLLAQWKNAPALPLTEIAALGVFLHGLCGDVAAQRLGEYSLMASDLIESLPEVLTKK